MKLYRFTEMNICILNILFSTFVNHKLLINENKNKRNSHYSNISSYNVTE